MVAACNPLLVHVELTGTFERGGTCTARVRGRTNRTISGKAVGYRMVEIEEIGGPGAYLVTCGGQGTRFTFVVPPRVFGAEPAEPLVPGKYRVSRYMPSITDPARSGFAGLLAVVHEPENDLLRRYDGDQGTLTITRVTPDPSAEPKLRERAVRVEGSFSVRATGSRLQLW